MLTVRYDQNGNEIERKGEPETPQPVRVITHLKFLERFTQAERTAIRQSTDPVVDDFMFMMEKAQNIDLDYPDTVQGMNYLEAQGLIAPGRAAEVLA
jgi:hypothetical protein